MRAITLYILFSILCLCVKAQDNGFNLNGRETELAIYVPTSTPVKGMQYTFPENVHSYYFDRSKKEIILLLKKEKEIKIGAVASLVVFDMDKNMVKWSININSFNVFFTNKYIISSENSNTHCYDRTNGKQVWKKTGANVKYVNEQKGILLTDYIRALDINSGKTLWQKYMPVKYNWEDIEEVDESSVIIAAGGLYRIDLQTGKGWNTNNLIDKSEFDIPSALGIVAGTPTNITVPRLDNNANVWKGTTSGILTDDNTTYIATNKTLFSLDTKTGGLNWQAALMEDITGSSTLILSGDRILLVNEGKITNKSGVAKKYGEPYLAFFNKESGTKEKSMRLPYEGSVSGIHQFKDTVKIFFDGGTYSYDLATDTDLGAKSYEDGTAPNAENREPQKFSSGISLYYDGENAIYDNSEILMKTPKVNKGFLHSNTLFIVDTKTLSVIPIEEPK